MPPITLNHRFTAVAAALLVTLVAALAGAASASAEVQSYSAYAKRGPIFYFHVDRVGRHRVKHAKVVVAGERWSMKRRRLMSGVRRNKVRAHMPHRVHWVLRHTVAAAAHRPAAARLYIHVRRKHRRGQTTTPPGTSTDPTTTTNNGNGNGSGQGNPPGAGPTSSETASCDAQFGSFGPGNWPSACWRPYNDSSPFNRKLPANPHLVDNSDAIVNRLMGFGTAQNLTAGRANTPEDYAHPTYWSQPDDPYFTVHCTEHWGTCALEGMRIQVPDAAKPATGSDGHMTVVDQASGWEYDMWQVKQKPSGGGQIVTSWGGKTRIDGDGLGSDAVAAEYGTMAGKLRIQELEAGRINHALFMFVNCDSGKAVFPAVHNGRACDEIGQSNSNAPSMGQRFQLDMSAAQIDALNVPEWKKTILHAMAEYGMYVGDTGGSWGIKEEGGQMYRSLGYKDPWVEFAKKVGAPYYAPDNDWVLNLAQGVDWQSHLRVVDPCEARGTCS
jgi:hypothetical protein